MHVHIQIKKNTYRNIHGIASSILNIRKELALTFILFHPLHACRYYMHFSYSYMDKFFFSKTLIYLSRFSAGHVLTDSHILLHIQHRKDHPSRFNEG